MCGKGYLLIDFINLVSVVCVCETETETDLPYVNVDEQKDCGQNVSLWESHRCVRGGAIYISEQAPQEMVQ